MRSGTPHEKKRESCQQSNGIMEGLTAYVQFSIFMISLKLKVTTPSHRGCDRESFFEL